MNRERIDEAIRHLSVWARRSPWQRLWDEVLEQHVGAVARINCGGAEGLL